MSVTASWRQGHAAPSPFKHDAVPYFVLPRGRDARSYLPDTCHTFHIGFGVDMAASMIVQLCKLALFRGTAGIRSLDGRLALAFRLYMEWCNSNKRYTSCREWSKKVLDMGENLGQFGVDGFKVKVWSLRALGF